MKIRVVDTPAVVATNPNPFRGDGIVSAGASSSSGANVTPRQIMFAQLVHSQFALHPEALVGLATEFNNMG